jgi:hypothetical protein
MKYEFKSKQEYELVHKAVKNQLFRLQDSIPWFKSKVTPEEVDQWEKDVETMKIFLKESGLIYHNELSKRNDVSIHNEEKR